jgi:hypothetical protein
MRRLALTQHTVRCPLEDRTASVTVRTNPGGSPSRRHLDVASCSLLPSASFAPRTRKVYFSDVAPPVSYLSKVDFAPRHSAGVACRRRCLSVLNAAESGAAEPIRCTSGLADGLELARQTQNPAIMRLLWFYSP